MASENRTTLTDALLEDLDDLYDDDDDDEVDNCGVNSSSSTAIETVVESTVVLDHSSAEPKDEIVHEKRGVIDRSALDDPKLNRHLNEIRNASSSSGVNAGKEEDLDNNRQPNKKSGEKKQLEERENQLVIQSNHFNANLATALSLAHHEICAAYRPKFPELEELVVDPIRYKNTVRVIMNETDLTRVNDALNEILTSNQIITVTVAASTTSGRQLTDDELEKIVTISDTIEEIIALQRELTEFVESRMKSLAPSVCALIGPTTAAKLMGLAGGLDQLSKIPACNLQVLGQVKESAASRAALSGKPQQRHAGILQECELVLKMSPQYIQKKTLKAVAGKLALAARVDFVNADTGRPRSSQAGEKFRQEIIDKIEQWQAPQKARVLKALPKPDLTIKKRRGGKRMRRLKERYEETELMKQANTRAFSQKVGEYGDDAMGLTMGMLDTEEGTSNVRRTTEKRKMRQSNTKASRKRAAQMAKTAAAGANANGMMSSVVFSTVQGMELIDPEARKNRIREANNKWFSENAGFQSAVPKK